MTASTTHKNPPRARVTAVAAAAVFALVAASPAHAAFVVEIFESAGSLRTMADALATIDDTPDSVAVVPSIDFFDDFRNQDRGLFDGRSLFPGNAHTTFVMRARTRITVATDATYTFATGGDDGVRLSVGGAIVMEDPSPLHAYALLGTDVFLTAGQHDVELAFFENTGHAQIEFMYALGQTGMFDPDNYSLIGRRVDVRDGFALVGTSEPTVVSQTYELVTTQPVPLPPSAWLFAAGLLPLACRRHVLR